MKPRGRGAASATISFYSAPPKSPLIPRILIQSGWICFGFEVNEQGVEFSRTLLLRNRAPPDSERFGFGFEARNFRAAAGGALLLRFGVCPHHCVGRWWRCGGGRSFPGFGGRFDPN
uniref:Uncharacterized protein n=1 Tax=Oryza punctata TaxID=4537 RepID=A0A0E0KWN9_ORYPU